MTIEVGVVVGHSGTNLVVCKERTWEKSTWLLANNDLMEFLSDFFFVKYKHLFKNKANETTDTKYEQQKKIHQNKSGPGVRFLGQAVLGYF